MKAYGNITVRAKGGGQLQPVAMDLPAGFAGAPDVTPYDVAGGNGRRSRAWRPGGYGPNAALSYSLDDLRRKSRDQTRKNPYARAAVDRLVTNIVGTGIVPRSTAARPTEGLASEEAERVKKEDAAFRARLQRLWLDWTDQADSAGVHDFYGLQALAVRSMVEGGETFIRLRTRRPEDGLVVPLQLQGIEGDQCPHAKTNAAQNIREGIQYNAIGRRSGYWLLREHPGEGGLLSGNGEPVLVPASDVVHLYRPGRQGQDRGEPWLAASLSTLYDLGGYLDAELVRKKNASRLVGFIKRTMEDDGTGAPGAGPMGSDAADDEGVATVDFEPGTLQVLADGEDVTFSNPPDVGPNFEAFVRESKRSIAAACGLLYEILSSDYSQLNDRTLRAALNDFRRAVGAWQDHLVIYQVCRPIWVRWVDLAILSGALKLPAGMRRQDAYAVNWIPPAWPYIHPVQDVEGKVLEIQAGLSTRTRKVAEGGYDSETVDAEQAGDNERADDLGLIYASDGRQKLKQAAAPAAATSEQDDGSEEPAPPPTQEPA